MLHTTRTDAIDEITCILSEADTTGGQYDIDAIADEVITTTGEGTGLRYLIDENKDFWAAVAAHAL